MTTPDETPECIDRHDQDRDPCGGAEEYRFALSGTGKSYVRCDKHWKARLKKQEEINKRYAPDSDVPPAGFDPTYAGERWDDEY